ncbi:MAG: hypothetical protein V4664_03420 [Patescibacteria group bacterium]
MKPASRVYEVVSVSVIPRGGDNSGIGASKMLHLDYFREVPEGRIQERFNHPNLRLCAYPAENVRYFLLLPEGDPQPGSGVPCPFELFRVMKDHRTQIASGHIDCEKLGRTASIGPVFKVITGAICPHYTFQVKQSHMDEFAEQSAAIIITS